MKWYTSGLAVPLLVNIGSGAWAAGTQGEFIGPNAVEKVSPLYPIAEADRGREGWVIVNYMIDQNGEVFEPTVLDSSGYANFEKAALRAIEKFRYEPATVDGVPVESANQMKFTFMLESGTDGARPSFVVSYRKIQQALEQGDLVVADQLLAELKEKQTSNLYEDAYLGLITGAVRGAQKDFSGMMYGLRRATANLDKAPYLDDEAARSAYLKLFLVETELQYFAEALETFDNLSQVKGSEAEVEWARQFADQIYDFLASDKGLATDAVLSNSGSWSRELLRRNFRVEAGEGDVSTVKLRCDAAYRMFTLESGTEIALETEWGDCHLQVLGKPGTTFRLVQF